MIEPTRIRIVEERPPVDAEGVGPEKVDAAPVKPSPVLRLHQLADWFERRHRHRDQEEVAHEALDRVAQHVDLFDVIVAVADDQPQDEDGLPGHRGRETQSQELSVLEEPTTRRAGKENLSRRRREDEIEPGNRTADRKLDQGRDGLSVGELGGHHDNDHEGGDQAADQPKKTPPVGERVVEYLAHVSAGDSWSLLPSSDRPLHARSVILLPICRAACRTSSSATSHLERMCFAKRSVHNTEGGG